MINTEYKELVYNYLYENYNKNIINYLKLRTKVLDVDTEIGMPFFSCFSNIKDNILSGVTIVVPGIYDIKSMCINIHEYRHGIDLYPYLNKNIDESNNQSMIDYYETLAKREEELFLDTIKVRKLLKK